jgi:predicted DNA-binding protein (MmcQ/YjbR family)
MDQVFLINGAKYKLRIPKSEEELQMIVEEHYKDIFGQESIFFSFKPKLRSDAGIGSKPDGCTLILSPKPRWAIVETELSGHPLYEHVIPQISKFIKALENPQNRKNIVEALYEEINKDPFKKALLEKLGMAHEIYKFLNDVVSAKPSIAIIIDERTAELDEVLGVLPLKAEITELRTFEREGVGLNVHGHLLSVEEAVGKEEEKESKERPEHMLNWKSRLEWVAPEIRELVDKLVRKAESQLTGTSGVPRFRWYYLYKGSGRRLDSLFAVLMVKKKKVSIRIKVDPMKFEDERKWTKKYKGWFFARKHEEREFSVSTPEQIDYAVKLIKQSYDISS